MFAGTPVGGYLKQLFTGTPVGGYLKQLLADTPVAGQALSGIIAHQLELLDFQDTGKVHVVQGIQIGIEFG